MDQTWGFMLYTNQPSFRWWQLRIIFLWYSGPQSFNVIIAILKPICIWIRASLVAQTVKNLPAIQEMQVWPLGWEDPLEKAMEPTPVFLPRKPHGWRSLVGYSPWSHKKLDVTERLHFYFMVAQTVKNLPAMQEMQLWSWVEKIPWRREWLPNPGFLPGGFHGQRSLVGYSPWGSSE